MNVQPTGFKDLLVLEPKVLGDVRGYFMESYNFQTLQQFGIQITFVQDNQSSSQQGVLRGMHYQLPPYAQTKLVRAISGTILDVAIDLRKAEPTYGKHFAIELSGENKKQLLVPKGFAHGFVVLSSSAEVFYKCDTFYRPDADRGIAYNDPALAIDWKLPASALVLSEKDKKHPSLKEANTPF